MTENAVGHAGWCGAGRCEVSLGGAHSSKPLVVEARGGSTARVAVRLWRYPGGQVWFELAVGDHGLGVRARTDLSLWQVGLLLEALTHARDEAADDLTVATRVPTLNACPHCSSPRPWRTPPPAPGTTSTSPAAPTPTAPGRAWTTTAPPPAGSPPSNSARPVSPNRTCGTPPRT